MLKYRTAAEMSVNIGCTVPPQVKAQLQALADQHGVSLSVVLRELLTKAVGERVPRHVA